MIPRITIAACCIMLLAGCTKNETPTAPTIRTGFVQDYKAPAFADQARLKKIQAFKPAIVQMFESMAIENHFPGVVYGIVVDDSLIISGGTGFTNIGKKIPATPKSMFRIASMTKSFTAMAILKLRDEGKLRLTDPASLYLKDMAGLTYLTEDSPEITIQNLLTMSAGFPEDSMRSSKTGSLFQTQLRENSNTATSAMECWEESSVLFPERLTRCTSRTIS
jgi:CubicO group peptidase (beta-lactamase class C family)